MKNRNKTIRKSILVTALFTLILSNISNAFNTNPNKILKKTTFTLNNVKPGNQLLIKDLNGIILYKEEIKDHGTYSKGFDLTSLPNGSYVFELEKDLEIKSFPFTIDSQNVVFSNAETTIHKPYVTLKDNYVYVSKLALNEEPLDIKIYSQNGSELIYSEKIKDTKAIQKVYKLAFNANGNYKIVLISNGREYCKNITL